MRKKNRYIRNGATLTAFAFMVIDGASQYVELSKQGKPF